MFQSQLVVSCLLGQFWVLMGRLDGMIEYAMVAADGIVTIDGVAGVDVTIWGCSLLRDDGLWADTIKVLLLFPFHGELPGIRVCSY